MLESLIKATKGALRRLAKTWGLASPEESEQCGHAPANAELTQSAIPPDRGEEPSNASGRHSERRTASTQGRAEHGSASAGNVQNAGDAPELNSAGPVDAVRVPELRGDAPPTALASIPSGYGETRVTALPRDPRCLYVYWEMTDEAIAAARTELGPECKNAGLVLRLESITRSPFAGAVFVREVPVEWASHNCFVDLERPCSAVRVELGMKNLEGRFAVLARSDEAEVPSATVSQDSRAEWMTVRAAAAPLAPCPVHREHAPAADPVPRPEGRSLGDASAEWNQSSSEGRGETGSDRWLVEARRALGLVLGGKTAATGASGAQEVALDRIAHWVRARVSEREAIADSAPIRVTAENHGPVEVWYLGGAGVPRHEREPAVLGGPWQVVIKGDDGRGGQRLLNAWQLHTELLGGSGITPAACQPFSKEASAEDLAAPSDQCALGQDQEVLASANARAWSLPIESLAGGASESLLLLGASELILNGVSEFGMLGASELAASSAPKRPVGSPAIPADGGTDVGAALGAVTSRSEEAPAGALGSAGWFGGASDMRLGEAGFIADRGASVATVRGRQADPNGGIPEDRECPPNDAVRAASSSQPEPASKSPRQAAPAPSVGGIAPHASC